jgi:hypothetical protein
VKMKTGRVLKLGFSISINVRHTPITDYREEEWQAKFWAIKQGGGEGGGGGGRANSKTGGAEPPFCYCPPLGFY